MANIAHASLTGAEIHEPKGITGAALGTVYVSNGSGTGTWANVGTSSLTGMIADFTWPIVQDGWLECDGSDVNTTTYSALYNVMTIQRTGTRTNGNPAITSLPSTANIKVGYYVFGTGISTGTTVLSIDSGTQITMSGNALSSGTTTVIFSPWLLNTGTIRLPDLTTAGRFRRSRSSATEVGQSQADQNKAHTHPISLTSATATGTTTPVFTGSSTAVSSSSTTSVLQNGGTIVTVGNGGVAVGVTWTSIPTVGVVPSNGSCVPLGTNSSIASHTHAVTGTSDSQGGTEGRPSSIVVMTCVKT